MANGLERGPAHLADALGDRVGHCENLVGLFIKQQMVVAEVRPAHVPVEILSLQVKREHVRQDGVHRRRDVIGRRRSQVGGGSQWNPLPELKFVHLRDRFLHGSSPCSL